ncbi:DUF3137 domain-containing protein [Bosea sp. (in: a-proteobacteria)]|jgi:hypothetical protein|uniref:DUF3137 domain-containing protein n=1 Tax=Bosea sp. (in: a-proteobacteria) TaxID=1871050 RepID=UPI002DDD8E34|nr:DUF3137 domain-containing protein [Bosea sp. (in: a-proteobacteria)]HEV2512171.1 DUF3137 domain-containing protein [Bosea sp. (in: a-proteobacteria)]
MTDPTSQAGQKAEPRRYTAVEMRQAQRKVGRYGGCLMMALFGVPLAIVAMVVMAGLLGPVAGVLLVMVAVVFGFFYNLLQTSLALLIPSAILAALVYVIYRHYHLPVATASPEAAARFATEIARLNTLRLEAARDTRRRVMLYVPAGLALAICFLMMPSRGSSSGILAGWLFAPFLLGFGAAVPWLIALSIPGGRYAKTFKRELMPLLLRRYGELRYVEGAVPAVGDLAARGLLPRYDRAEIDDAIAGRYAGYELRLSELELERKSGKNNSTVFNGLLLTLAVDTPFLGTTMVLDQRRPTPSGLMPVRLEDPRFASIYDVYGNDQVEARAVLTPAVMERLLSMADGGDFFPPSCLVERDSITFAVAQTGTRLLFEPPSLQAHDAAAQLQHLEDELALVFRLVDAMIAMHVAVKPGGVMPAGTSFSEQPAVPPSDPSR